MTDKKIGDKIKVVVPLKDSKGKIIPSTMIGKVVEVTDLDYIVEVIYNVKGGARKSLIIVKHNSLNSK